MSKELIKGMPSKQVYKCEGCGEYHDAEDCEVVVIKVIKGKNCKIGAVFQKPVTVPYDNGVLPLFPNNNIRENMMPVEKKDVTPLDLLAKEFPDGRPAYETKKIENAGELEKAHARMAVIPPHLRGVFMPADSPGAATEQRG